MRRRVDGALSLVIAKKAVRAGSSLTGEVVGARDQVIVRLQLVEASPVGSYAPVVSVARTWVEGDTTMFELPTPEDAAPASAGRHCRLGFVVTAADAGSRRQRRQVTVPVDISGGEQAIHESTHLDRIVPSQAGKNFHLELADLSLQGGGHLAGRVHVEPGFGEARFAVAARCEEAWRTNLRVRNRHAPALWRGESIWEQELEIELAPDRHWHPFRFDIPGELPPAFEGHSIVWRYEISAQRLPRGLLTSHAIVSPLRFDTVV